VSIKKVHLYNMVWQKMLDHCRALCRPATAGELARVMGVSRSTMVRWLSDMIAEGAICSFRTVGKNHLPMSTFEPVGRGETWFYGYDMMGTDEIDV